jgi:hypothetical protein
MLRDEQMAGLVKLHRSASEDRRWPLWADHVGRATWVCDLADAMHCASRPLPFRVMNGRFRDKL